MTSIDAEPPAFEPTTIELVARTDSKITDVSIYTTRAEITRVFKVAVKSGHNNVQIKGLPNLFEDSLRVKGRGQATIHDVSISRQSQISARTAKSPEMTALLRKKDRLDKALDRARNSLAALHTYLDSLSAEHVDASKLGEIIRRCEEEAERCDDRVLELEEEVKRVEEDITAQEAKDDTKGKDSKLGMNVAVGIFSDAEGTVEIALIYAVSGASWTPIYDIRVNMQEKEKPISLTYKAELKQDTGEDWDNVPITLETASPTFGLSVPRLSPWHLSTQKRPHRFSYTTSRSAYDSSDQPFYSIGFKSAISNEETYNRMGVRETNVSSKGSINASFKVMGLTSVLSGDDVKNVTIARLELGARMSWVVVPKKDTRVRLGAKIVNASEYTLLSGTASVYMDGSFISKSEVPTVSPAESFNCPLGLDPAIRVTYHPLTRNLTQSGFYSKTSTHAFTQRISVVNTKTTAIGDLKVVDQFPVSQDATITVKIQSPKLSVSAVKEASSSAATNTKVTEGKDGEASSGVAKVAVSDGVVAMWEPEDEHAGAGETEAAGKDGRFCWVCEVPAQGKVGLAMQWEVGAPVKREVYGL